MVWWGVIVVALIAAGVGALIVRLTINRPMADIRAARELAQIQKRTAEKMAAAERAAHRAVAAERADLARKLRSINAWYAEQKWRVGENAQKMYETLAGDPDQLDRELDRILEPRER